MEKVSLLLMGQAPRGEGLTELETELRTVTPVELRRRGASRIQVNVVDSALGHPHGLKPQEGEDIVLAALSYWVPAAGEHGIHGQCLPDLAGASWHGYLVCEAVQLEGPPPPGDGGRSKGFTQIVPLRVHADLSWAEWRRRWQGEHTPVAVETQSSFRYVHNVVVRPLAARVMPFAAVVEESFPLDAARDQAVFYDAPGDDKRLADNTTRMMESCARFISGPVPIAWTAEYRLPD